MTNPKVLVATLLCDRKAHSQTIALPAIYGLDYDNFDVYINIETKDPFNADEIKSPVGKLKENDIWAPLKNLIAEHNNIHTQVDCWQIHNSSWWKKPQFDQDQSRLFPICIARNMTRDCAMFSRSLDGSEYDYIFFIDADVIPPPDSLKRLLNHKKMLISGLVPGRNEHKNARYEFHVQRVHPEGLSETIHATCGFTLIHKDLYQVLPFRSGPSAIDRSDILSEDPAFGTDAMFVWKTNHNQYGKGNLPPDRLCDSWWVDRTLKAKHVDDDVNDFSTGAQF